MWPEYSHDRTGRVDFFMPDKRWAVGLLQNGTYGQILEHVDRYDTLGKYETWGVINEYIVFNFCYDKSHRDLRNIRKSIVEILFSQEN